MSSLRVGTSGFAYKEWKPSFYPADLPQTEFLRYYGSRLDAVEIDYTFYRMPNRKILEAWREATPEEFRFALKVSRKITHFERLRLPSDALDYLLGVVPALGERLGILLFQLPPNFKADPDRLALLLGSLPSTLRYAFEFRHASWFTPQIYALLGAHDVALCIHDSDDQTTPLERTGLRSYVRLRRSAYSESELEQWRDRLTAWARDGVDVFAFFKHEDNPDAPRIALDFARRCRRERT